MQNNDFDFVDISAFVNSCAEEDIDFINGGGDILIGGDTGFADAPQHQLFSPTDLKPSSERQLQAEKVQSILSSYCTRRGFSRALTERLIDRHMKQSTLTESSRDTSNSMVNLLNSDVLVKNECSAMVSTDSTLSKDKSITSTPSKPVLNENNLTFEVAISGSSGKEICLPNAVSMFDSFRKFCESCMDLRDVSHDLCMGLMCLVSMRFCHTGVIAQARAFLSQCLTSLAVVKCERVKWQQCLLSLEQCCTILERTHSKLEVNGSTSAFDNCMKRIVQNVVHLSDTQWQLIFGFLTAPNKIIDSISMLNAIFVEALRQLVRIAPEAELAALSGRNKNKLNRDGEDDGCSFEDSHSLLDELESDVKMEGLEINKEASTIESTCLIDRPVILYKLVNPSKRRINCARFCPSVNYLVTTMEDVGAVNVWRLSPNVSLGEERCSGTGHSMHLGPPYLGKGLTNVDASVTGVPASGNLSRNGIFLRGLSGTVYDFQFPVWDNCKGQSLLAADESGAIRLFDLATTNLLVNYEFQNLQAMTSLAILSATDLFASGSVDCNVRIGIFDRLNPLRVLCGHKSPVVKVEMLRLPGRGQEGVLSASADRSIRLWDIRAALPVRIYDTTSALGGSMPVHLTYNDRIQAFACANDSNAQLFDIRSAKGLGKPIEYNQSSSVSRRKRTTFVSMLKFVTGGMPDPLLTIGMSNGMVRFCTVDEQLAICEIESRDFDDKCRMLDLVLDGRSNELCCFVCK